jgi:putative sterol carrier protein
VSPEPTDPEEFYTRRIPDHFNQTLESQRALGESGAEILANMEDVNATLYVVVEGARGGHFYLDIEAGRMSPADIPGRPPFITLVHDWDSFRVLERESGDSILGFLGKLAGLQKEMRLTTRRVETLASLNGTLRFTLTGDNGFELFAHFGSADVDQEPSCVIRLDQETYADLQSGALSPQDAFLGGRVQVEGDMQIAISLALAAVSPD